MKLHKVSFFRRLLKDMRGQTAPLMAVSMLAYIGIAGVSIDLGHAYFARQQLQSSSNAAALAGAAVMPNITSATTNVTLYSAMAGEMNAGSSLPNVLVTPAFYFAP